MIVKTILDNVTSFFMDPSNDNQKPLIQGVAWVSTILLGVATIGIVHGLSALWRYLRHIDKNETHEKIGRVFQGIFLRNNKDNQSVAETTNPILPVNREVKVQEVPQNPRTVLTFQELAQTIYNNSAELWHAAQKSANEDQTLAMTYFINKIRDQFRKNGKSLSDIPLHLDALNILFQDRRLRMALLNYARANKLQNLLDKHLVFAIQNIYDKRDDYTALAAKKDIGNFMGLWGNLTNIIRTLLRNEGRSLKEVFSNKEALEIFKKSSRLMLVLYCYTEMQKLPQQNPSNKKSHSELENQQVKEAVKLGRNDARGPGLVTRVGLNEFQSNEEQLLKGIKKFLLLNHPDKNPKADLELVKDANQLLDMLRNGVYGDYKAALEKYRNQ